MIREIRKNPDDRIFDLIEIDERRNSQALTRGDERYSGQSEFRPRKILSTADTFLTEDDLGSHPRLILVDDFLTSGSTLRSAAEATRKGLETLGWFGGRFARLDVFVLGFRPALFGGEG
jgi:hypothetical protein